VKRIQNDAQDNVTRDAKLI